MSVEKKVIEKVAIENIDPKDLWLKFFSRGILPEHMARYKFVSQYLESKEDSSPEFILDMPSGRGYGSDILGKAFPNSQVIGLEKGFDYSKFANKKYSKKESSTLIGFINGDVRTLPLPEKTADIITAFEIVEHLKKEDQIKLFAEINRVLNDKGKAFISFPERYSFHHNKKGKLVRNKIVSNPHHLYEPTANEVEKMLSENNLIIEQRLGQVFVKKQLMKRIMEISRVSPLYSICYWTDLFGLLERDYTPTKKNKNQGKTPFTHIYVVKKA